MKNAGIITFHNALSLGANLQAYSLQEVLKKEKIVPQFINYNRNYLGIEPLIHNVNMKQKIKKNIIKIASLTMNKEAVSKAVVDFRDNYLNISPKAYNTIEELKDDPPSYDYYITGSDQVWNPTTTFLEAYYLTFVQNNNKTIAYAPSIGISKIPEQFKTKMKEYISHVQYLSCRESIGAKALEELTGREVTMFWIQPFY